jgi:hypothetical protein
MYDVWLILNRRKNWSDLFASRQLPGNNVNNYETARNMELGPLEAWKMRGTYFNATFPLNIANCR